MHQQLRKFITGLSVKAGDATDAAPHGLLVGYASTFDVDLVGDRIMPGAWAKSIKEVVPAGRVKLVDGHNLYSGAVAIIGKVTMAIEDNKGLLIEAPFASTAPAQMVRTLVQENVLSDFSVGFRIVRDGLNVADRVREITEAALVEVSVVAMPANPEARILRVKSAGSQYFKMAPKEHQWDAAQAEARFKAWVNPAPAEEWNFKDWGIFASGFLFANAEQRQFLLVDIVDGAPAYVLGAADDALKMLRTGPAGPWTPEAKKLEEGLQALYKEAGADFPEAGAVTLVDPADDSFQKLMDHARMSAFLMKHKNSQLVSK